MEFSEGSNKSLMDKETCCNNNNGVTIRTAQNMSSSFMRKKSDPILVSTIRFRILRELLANLQEVILGTKLAVLFPAIPLAIVADFYKFGRPWIFALSLLGLTPLAERVSFLTEQIAYFTGPTVGGLLNATCGNATELIIALFALYRNKIHVLKYSLMGSILSNLLLVLGTSLLCGGLANLKREQRYDRKQADVNSGLLLLGLLCHMLPLMFKYAVKPETGVSIAEYTLELSRASSVVMLVAYIGYIVFQLKTHRQIFESQEDISLGVALGSATQISMFAVPLCVVVGWIMRIKMDLDFNLLETGCLALTILVVAFTLQDGTSHYMKGVHRWIKLMSNRDSTHRCQPSRAPPFTPEIPQG
ncbi:Vacuolar cation/proton exchanger 3 -like protein [Gossypium arboreum]|uniref:Vacuolar cation/proton exchanger 3-like protein n=1 Tax=Gossypium arboreum TaxID=29729 RepID=A0A0B0N3P1_GOSAR|nr:Vacuolar cation/proton exchanger 3 -like protein [Gossypium arboreum]